VAAAHVVERVVVGPQEVPPGDVVDVPVRVVVDAVTERRIKDQVLRIKQPVVVAIGDRGVIGIPRAVEPAIAVVIEHPAARRPELSGVEVRLGGEVRHLRGTAPEDARVEYGDQDVITALFQSPGQVDPGASSATEVMRGAGPLRNSRGRELIVQIPELGREARSIRVLVPGGRAVGRSR